MKYIKIWKIGIVLLLLCAMAGTAEAYSISDNISLSETIESGTVIHASITNFSSTQLPNDTISNIVPVAPYYADSMPYDSPAIGSGSTDILCTGHNSRIRQTGNITRVKFAIADVSNVTDFRVKIWSWNGSDYIVSSVSDNLISEMSSGINIINLTTPIAAKEGDFYGVYFSSTSYSIQTITSTGASYEYIKPSSNPGIGDAWGTPTGSNPTKFYPVAFYMEAPTAVFIGDSTTAGHPAHYTFIEATNTTNLLSQTAYHFGKNGDNITYQNMGIGSQNCADIRARFDDDVTSLHPQFGIIETGLNEGDAVGEIATQQAILEDIEEMIQLCINNSIIPVVFEVPPATVDTDYKATGRNNVTNGIYDLQNSYNFVVFGVREIVGDLNETSGKWSIKPEYDCGDGLHYNVAGYTAMGEALYSQLVNESRIYNISVTVDGATQQWFTESDNPLLYSLNNDIDYITMNYDSLGITGSVDVDIIFTPVANFTAHATSGATPLIIQFTDSSTGLPTSWLWNFGDGETSTEQNPTHTYDESGIYTVSLTTTNDAGSDILIRTDYITVNPDFTQSSEIATDTVPVIMATVLIIISGFVISALRGKAEVSDMVTIGIALMILMAIIYMMYGIGTKMEEVFSFI